MVFVGILFPSCSSICSSAVRSSLELFPVSRSRLARLSGRLQCWGDQQQVRLESHQDIWLEVELVEKFKISFERFEFLLNLNTPTLRVQPPCVGVDKTGLWPAEKPSNTFPLPADLGNRPVRSSFLENLYLQRQGHRRPVRAIAHAAARYTTLPLARISSRTKGLTRAASTSSSGV